MGLNFSALCTISSISALNATLYAKICKAPHCFPLRNRKSVIGFLSLYEVGMIFSSPSSGHGITYCSTSIIAPSRYGKLHQYLESEILD